MGISTKVLGDYPLTGCHRCIRRTTQPLALEDAKRKSTSSPLSSRKAGGRTIAWKVEEIGGGIER